MTKREIAALSFKVISIYSLFAMQAKKDIILWKCHFCGRDFDAIDGGICRKCGKITCNVCFGLGKLKRLGKLKMPEARVCRTCADKKGPETY
jgi:hypothetical protein